jgi:hypothetical protein
MKSFLQNNIDTFNTVTSKYTAVYKETSKNYIILSRFQLAELQLKEQTNNAALNIIKKYNRNRNQITH